MRASFFTTPSVRQPRWAPVVTLGAIVFGAMTVNAFNSSAPATVSQPAERLGPVVGNGTHTFSVAPTTTFDQAWAMSFIPNSSLALITERPGRLLLRNMDSGVTQSVAGVPSVIFAGQGGLGDIIVDPQYNGSTNQSVYLSWAEGGSGGTSGAAVGRATLDLSRATAPRLADLRVIWRQNPKVAGTGHFAHRLAFSPDGAHLFITSGERQQMTPAQDPNSDLGKIIRYHLSTGTAERWTWGHRNPLGIAFAPDGKLWSSEMGPQGGDELNYIVRGNNYGWPNASNGSHYGGAEIPDHRVGDGYAAPATWWTPSVSPGSLMIYRGKAFPNWYGDAFLGALSGESFIHVRLDGTVATKAEQWPMDARIRVVVEDPRDGTIWLIEDGPGGRLLHLTPA